MSETSLRRRRNGSQVLSVFLTLAALALGFAGVSYWYLRGSQSLAWRQDALNAESEEFPPAVGTGSTPGSITKTFATSNPSSTDVSFEQPQLSEVAPEPELPSLDASDLAWRAAVGSDAIHPLVGRFMARKDLIRTLVVATLQIAEGITPAKRFDYLAPSRAFEIEGTMLDARIDPKSYARYDLLVDAFLALDMDQLLGSYARFESLFDAAYAELGYPDEDFDEQIELAIDVLLRVPVLETAPALIPRATTYAFEDPALEELLPSQRQLLRMGPRNVARVQQRLRELLVLLQER